MRWALTIAGVLAVLLVGIGALIYATYWPDIPAVQTQVDDATTKPATAPATPPSAAKIVAYSDLIRSLDGFAEAEFSDERLPLDQAARVRLSYPTYICSRKHLWISHPEAMPAGRTQDEPARGVHLVKEEVVFVHWVQQGKQMRANVVYRDRMGAFRIARRSANQEDPKLQRFDYHWQDGLSVDGRMVVPTDLGVAVITPGETLKQEYLAITETGEHRPAVAITPAGFVAWIPAQQADSPITAIAHYMQGAWKKTEDEAWKGPFLHLIPLADGSVLQIRPDEDGKVKLRIEPLEASPADPVLVKKLVGQLSDDDPWIRDSAHASLVVLGPAAWKVMEELSATASGEAQIRIQEISRSRNDPTLGRFRPVNGQLQPVWRVQDGVVYLAPEGVTARADQEAIQPAWLSVRRTRPVELLPQGLTNALAVGAVQLYASGNEWVVSDELNGARILFGQELLPLGREKDGKYTELRGVDGQGRVLLANPSAGRLKHEYLLIDPLIADPAPVLQLWEMYMSGGEVGWDEENWPVVKRTQAYALKEHGWEPLKGELKTQFTPTTMPNAGGQAVTVAGKIGDYTVAVGPGILELRGEKTVRQDRPLDVKDPELAAIAHDKWLYMLYPTAIVRLRVDPAKEKPFSLDTVFMQDVPTMALVKRAWIDPAGRLCIMTDENLVIVFTGRKVPPAILDMIPTEELRKAKP